jgi:PAS domain-containing protein
MSDPIADPGPRATLRQQAQQQLVAGIAPASRGWGVSVEALALLHRLASTPASAGDALNLLHELQVHQVELDLQQAQLEANEHELAEELARYRALYEHAPVANFVLDDGGRIVECNRAGAILFGASSGEICGRRFDEFLSADSRLPLAGLLRDARAGATNPCRMVRPGRDPINAQNWRISASAVDGCDAIQLVVSDGAGSPEG